MTQTQLIWTDERIEQSLQPMQQRDGGLNRYEVENIMRQMRDEMEVCIGGLEMLRDDMQAGLTALEIDNDSLRQRVQELTDTLTFAASYKGIEGKACPLCRYENGVFVESCQMHKDMDRLRQRVTNLDAANNLLREFLDAAQQRITEFEAQLDAAQGWEPLPNDVYTDGSNVWPTVITVDDSSVYVSNNGFNLPYNIRLCRRTPAAQQWETLDTLESIEDKPSVITRAQYRGLINTGWRLQRRTPAAGE